MFDHRPAFSRNKQELLPVVKQRSACIQILFVRNFPGHACLVSHKLDLLVKLKKYLFDRGLVGNVVKPYCIYFSHFFTKEKPRPEWDLNLHILPSAQANRLYQLNCRLGSTSVTLFSMGNSHICALGLRLGTRLALGLGLWLGLGLRLRLGLRLGLGLGL